MEVLTNEEDWRYCKECDVHFVTPADKAHHNATKKHKNKVNSLNSSTPKNQDTSLIPSWYLNPDSVESMEIYEYLKSLPENNLRDKIVKDIYRKVIARNNREVIEDYITNPESALYIEWVSNALSETIGIKRTKDDIEKLRKEKENLMDDIEENKVKLESLNSQLASMKNEIAGYQSEIEKYKADIMRIRSFKPITTLDQIIDAIMDVMVKNQSIISNNSKQTLLNVMDSLKSMKNEISQPVREITDKDVELLKSEIEREFDILKEKTALRKFVKLRKDLEKKTHKNISNDGYTIWIEDLDEIRRELDELLQMLEVKE